MRSTKEAPTHRKRKVEADDGREFDVVVEGIVKAFSGNTALGGVDLKVRKGEFVTLLGPSGCGKSTLLRIITGLEVQDEGKVYLAGREVSKVPPHRRPVSLVFQNLALFPHMTVEDNIGFPLKMAKMKREDIKKEVAHYLELVRLDGYEKRLVTEMSGGQRQRIALARSLAHKPAVLLLDEPLSALDEKLRKEMQVELKNFQQQMGTTFVYVTHDQEEALVMSDRIAVFSKGHIEQFGRPLDIYNEPATTFVADFIGETNLLPGTVARDGDSTTVITELGTMDAGDRAVGMPDGAKVHVSVRPEHVHVERVGVEDSTNYPIRLEGSVSDVLFYGSDVKVTADVNGERITARVPVNSFGTRLTNGERVIMSWAPTSMALIPNKTD